MTKYAASDLINGNNIQTYAYIQSSMNMHSINRGITWAYVLKYSLFDSIYTQMHQLLDQTKKSVNEYRKFPTSSVVLWLISMHHIARSEALFQKLHHLLEQTIIFAHCLPKTQLKPEK